MPSVRQLVKKFKDMPYNTRQGLVILGLIVVLISIPVTVSVIRQNPQFISKAATSFTETFDGTPSTPTPIQQTPSYANWDVHIHSRDYSTWADDGLTSMEADHGTDCSGNPVPAQFPTHENHTYAGTVFNCNNHLMTAHGEGGYSLITLTPDQLVDFSQGCATVSWRMSTFESSTRDWVDFWIQPFATHKSLPVTNAPDLNGPSPNSLEVLLNGAWSVYEFDANKDGTQLSGYQTSLADHLLPKLPDKARRDLVQINICPSAGGNPGTLKVSMPEYNYTIYDGTHNLPFTQGTFQIAHHAYNPHKGENIDGCAQGFQPCGLTNALQNTWHWDDINISPSVPFTLIHTTPRAVNYSGRDIDIQRVTFASAVPNNAVLRFNAQAVLSLKFEGQSTFTAVNPVDTSTGLPHSTGDQYIVPAPAGSHYVDVQTDGTALIDGWYNCSWECNARDFAIWSQTSSGGGNNCTKVADINCDGAINILDMSILLSKWNTSDATSDINKDSKVNILDLSILLSKWGT